VRILMRKTMATLCHMVNRKICPSYPTRLAAAVATKMDCGEIILPVTPPEELAATVSAGSTPIWVAVVF